jgi:hypothetical protein
MDSTGLAWPGALSFDRDQMQVRHFAAALCVPSMVGAAGKPDRIRSMIKTSLTLCAALGLVLAAGPALADAPAVAAAAKFSLDTPIETLVADPKAKAVLDADLPGLTAHPQYEQFKSMNLTTLAGFAPDKLTPERLDKVKADLAKL